MRSSGRPREGYRSALSEALAHPWRTLAELAVLLLLVAAWMAVVA